MSEPSSTETQADAAALLRLLLAAVERGELVAPTLMLAYLEGALAALEQVSPKPS
jgi:hypothetical protein